MVPPALLGELGRGLGLSLLRARREADQPEPRRSTTDNITMEGHTDTAAVFMHDSAERRDSSEPPLPVSTLLDSLSYINMADDDAPAIDFVSLGMFILGTASPSPAPQLSRALS